MPMGVLPRCCSFSPGPEPPVSEPPAVSLVEPTLPAGVEYATPSGPCCIAAHPAPATAIARMPAAVRVRNIRASFISGPGPLRGLLDGSRILDGLRIHALVGDILVRALEVDVRAVIAGILYTIIKKIESLCGAQLALAFDTLPLPLIRPA